MVDSDGHAPTMVAPGRARAGRPVDGPDTPLRRTGRRRPPSGRPAPGRDGPRGSVVVGVLVAIIVRPARDPWSW